MKITKLLLLLALLVTSVSAFSDDEVLQFKAKIGFDKVEDQIIEHKFFDNGKKLWLIGRKTIQLWDVENTKLLSSVPHEIPQFAPKGLLVKYILLGLPEIWNWKPYYIQLDGRWMVTVEKPDDKKSDSAIVRELQTAKTIATLELPNSISTKLITFDDKKDEIVTFGKTDKRAAFANWDKDTFKLKRVVAIDDYRWHQLIRNEEKMLVGTGDTKIAWSGGEKHGDTLTLRDVKTGAVEKEFTAKDLIPDTAYQETVVSQDEKFLLSRRNKRIFVWEIDGSGSPKFEISATNPKEKVELIDVVGGKFIVVSVDKTLRVYDFGGNGQPKYELVSTDPEDRVSMGAKTKDGKYITVYTDNKLLVLETAGNGKPLYEVAKQDEKEFFTNVKFIEKENYLAIGRNSRKKGASEKTEFYNIESGKIAFEVPFGVEDDITFTPDKKFLYTEELGSANVWNFAESKAFRIPLYMTRSESQDSNGMTTYGDWENDEHTALSPNNRLILKYGGSIVSVFDIETGKEIQTIFDAEKVKYDKQNKIKNSGISEARWSEDGTYVYAFANSGFGGGIKTMSFWQVK